MLECAPFILRSCAGSLSEPLTTPTLPGKAQPAPLGEDDFGATAASFSALAQGVKALGDSQRLWLLRLLRHSAYAVSELATILAVSQPALSHHLKKLFEASLVDRHREGNSHYYRRGSACATEPFASILTALDALPLAARLEQRRDAVLTEREQQSQRFFDSHAEAFATQRARISTPASYGEVLLAQIGGFTEQPQRALEIGPGDGALLSHLAGRFREIVALDHSEAMLSNSASVAGALPNVSFRQQRFEDLEARGDFDLVVAAMVLHHSSDPAGFIGHSAGCLRPGGVLALVELCPHDQHWAQEACGDRWLGFETEELIGWAQTAGLACLATEYLAQRNGFRIQILSFRQSAETAAATPAAMPHH